MILLKDLLLEMSSQNLLIPRKLEGRMEKYIESKIKEYKKNNNVGDFDISGLGLTKLPTSLKDLKIGGTFDCSNNKLKFLTNSPVVVGLDFNCNNNLLEDTLAGAPTRVVGDFYCSYNLLDTLVGAPVTVGGSFYCSRNSLTSLDGLIRDDGVRMSVGRDFYCYDNRGLKFTKEQVRTVCDVTRKIFV